MGMSYFRHKINYALQMGRQSFKHLFKVVVSLVLIAILISKMDINSIRVLLSQIPPGAFAFIILIFFVSVWINALKWNVLLTREHLWNLARVCFEAQFYATVLPGQLFGEVSKIGKLHNSKSPVELVTSSVLLDKITGLMGTICIGFLGIATTKTKLPVALPLCFGAAFLLLLFLVFASGTKLCESIVRQTSTVISRINCLKSMKIGDKILNFFYVWKEYTSKKTLIFMSVLIGLLNQCVGVFHICLISSLLGLQLTFADYCWILAALSIVLLLPISFGGLGLRDVSLAGFLSLYQVSIENAVIISAMLYISQLAAACIGGITILAEHLFARKKLQK